MKYKALIFDTAAINCFLSGANLSPQWWTDFQIGDASTALFTVYVDDYCYVLASDSAESNHRLIIKLEPGKLFSGFSEETDKNEALHRCVSAAQRFFEGKIHPLPLSWKPYSKGDIKSFQSNSKTSGDTRRIIARNSGSTLKNIYAFDLTSRQAEFDSLTPDEQVFSEATARFPRAVSEGKRHFSTVNTGVEDIPLHITLLPTIPSNAPLDQIITNHLTDEQKRFVTLPLLPIRLSGVAGTGKTFAMVIKFLHEAYQRIDKSENFRFLFLTHNTTAKDLVNIYISHLDTRDAIDSKDQNRLIQTDTLLNLAYNFLAAELTDVDPVSIDAHVGKKIELDFISDIVVNYRRGQWLTRRSKTSERMREWVTAEKGTPTHLNFCWDVMNEIACSLDAENVRDNPERRARYINNARSRSVMRLENGADREVLLDIYDQFRNVLRELNVISTDQLMLDFMGYLDSFRWEIKRAQEGYDAIFVDEFHLFNAVERGVFLPLLKKRASSPALLMAYDVQQSPREAFLGLSNGNIQSPIGNFSVSNAQKVQLTDIFRYTPEIGAALRHISHENPIDGIDSDWLSPDASSRLPSGPKPIAIQLGSTQALYDFAFENAVRLGKEMGYRDVAVLSLSYPIFDQIKHSGKYRDRLFVIDSREDLMKIQYTGKRVIFSSPEYVSGFQFDAVFVCDANLNDADVGARTTWQNRRFASSLYLAASRAKRTLFFLGDGSFGGLAEIVKSGVSNGFIELRS